MMIPCMHRIMLDSLNFFFLLLGNRLEPSGQKYYWSDVMNSNVVCIFFLRMKFYKDRIISGGMSLACQVMQKKNRV